MKRKDLLDIAKSAIASSAKDDVGLLSAGLTYYVFLSLFPLLLLGLTLATFFVGEDEARRFIFSEVAKVIPGALDLLEDVVTAAYENQSGLLIISVAVLAFSASNAFGTLDKAVNRAWSTEKMPNFLIAKLFSFLMMAILGVLIILSLLVSAALTFLQDTVVPMQIAPFGFIMGSALTLANLVTSVGFVFLGFLLMYRFLPKARVLLGDVWVAALASAFAWVIVKVGFTFYLSTSFGNYNAVYGTLGTAVALLFWLYISCMVILYGAEFAAEVYHLRVARKNAPEPPSEQKPKQSPWFKL